MGEGDPENAKFEGRDGAARSRPFGRQENDRRAIASGLTASSCSADRWRLALYLALSLGRRDIAQQLFEKDKELSYSGPDGQNALHAAITVEAGRRCNAKNFLENNGCESAHSFSFEKSSSEIHIGKAVWQRYY